MVSANRDTFVFAVDSVPDTLETPVNYRSFYTPVKIIKEKTIEDTSVSNEKPITPALEEIKKAGVPNPVPQEQNKEMAPLEDDLLDGAPLVPADTSSAPVDSLSIATPVLEPESPILPDSVKTPSIEMPADSTK